MDNEFWLNKWQRGETGFHEPQAHRLLTAHWAGLAMPADEPVLVPLCGKSRDLVWLRDRGHRVIGVELSELAVSAFFAEHGMEPRRRRVGAFECFEAEGIEILCGDFFALEATMLPPLTSFYDRAALIALRKDLRRNYAAHLGRLLRPGSRGLVVTLEYTPSLEINPPYSVDAQELAALYGERFSIEAVAREDILAQSDKLRRRGLEALWECAYRLKEK